MRKHEWPIALLLTAILLLCAAASASAEDVIIDSGSCGSKVTWTLTAPNVESTEYTLAIGGTGEMYGYYSDSMPWYSYQGNIRSIIIKSGVTSIGNAAFFNCSGLTSVTIPDSVTSIGSWAFGYCSGLTSVTIPDSVTSIGGNAFYSCGKIKEIHIQSIKGWLSTVYSDSYSHPNYFSSSFDLYVNGQRITDLVIPDSVTSIGSTAFCKCSGLTSVTIPDSVTSIGSSAFEGCSGLTSVTIPDSVTSIGDYAFRNCSGLTSVTIPDSVTSIGDRAFEYCSSLTSVTIPDSVTSIGDCAFRYCSSLTSVTVPDSVTSIGYSAFENCSGLTSVTIPDSVTSIGDAAFRNCSGLTSVTIPDSVTSIGDAAFRNCSGLTSVTIPDSVTSIGSYAFYNCNGLTSVTIPDSVTSIGEGAFYGCGKIKEIHIQSIEGWLSTVYSNVESHPNYYYDSSINLYVNGQRISDLVIPDSVTSIGDYAFYNCSGLTSVTIPDSVTSIGSSAFRNCSSLTSVTIPDRVTSISYGTFWDCSNLTSITIPDNVTSIGEYAFCNCSKLTSITIPDGVTSIGGSAFHSCSSLTSITIPNSVTSIGNDAFVGCSSLTSVMIPDSVTSISNYAFHSCSSLTSITIPDNVTSIGNYAFYGCSSLTSIILPDSVTSIGDAAFKNCSSLTSVTIPDSVTSIGYYAFNSCSGLTSVTIPDSVTSIGSYAFAYCYSLSLTLPDHISAIGDRAFTSISKLLCSPGSVTSAAVAKAGQDYYDKSHPEFRLTETEDRFTVSGYNGGYASVIIPDRYNGWTCSSVFTSLRLPGTLGAADTFTLHARNVTVPEGVSAMGTLSLSGVQKIFIPASVTDMSMVNVTDGSIPAVYCIRNSEAELWAVVNGYTIIYTDGTGWDDTCVLTYAGKEIRLDVGEEYTLSASDFSIQPLPTGDLSVTLTGNTKVSADGLTLKGKKAGNTNITATMAGRTVNVPVHVYKKVTSFVLTSQRFAEAGKSFTVTLSDALPADISGKFTWQQDNGTPVTDTVLTHTFTAPSQPGSTVITVTAPGGYSQSVTVTVAGSIGVPYGGANVRNAMLGELVDICVVVDGTVFTNQPETYGTITIPASAASILELTEDNCVRAIGAGRTAFSVVGLNGTKVNIMVIVKDARTVLTLPAGTVSIGEEAFAGVAAQKAVLPSGCVSIGSRAFAGSAVQIVNVPASVTSIADDAFSGCSVTVYCPAGSYAESWCAAHSVNCVAE